MSCVAPINTACSISLMDDWIKIVRARMEKLGITQDQLAERLGFTQGAVGHWLTGRREPKLADINRMLHEVGMPPLTVATPLKADRSNIEMALQPSGKPTLYPVVSEVIAGYAVESVENYPPGVAEEYLESTENAGPKGYWLRVNGQSMTSDTPPSFPEGTPILIRPEGFELITGKFYVFQNREGESTFKQYVSDAGTQYMKPLNKAFHMIRMDEGWVAVGRVVDAKITGL